MKPYEIPVNLLKQGKSLGQGAFGKVIQGTYYDKEKEELRDVAIKSAKHKTDLLLEEIILMNHIK